MVNSNCSSLGVALGGMLLRFTFLYKQLHFQFEHEVANGGESSLVSYFELQTGALYGAVQEGRGKELHCMLVWSLTVVDEIYRQLQCENLPIFQSEGGLFRHVNTLFCKQLLLKGQGSKIGLQSRSKLENF